MASASVGAVPAVYGHEPFVVPGGTLRLTVEAEWRCVTMCPLDIRLVDPDGEVAATADGGSNATLAVEAPVAGSWGFDFSAREGGTVGTEGVARLTFETLA